MATPRQKNTPSFKIGTKFEDVDTGGIIWKYEIEAISGNVDTVRGNQYAYLVAVYYEDLDENEEVFLRRTYTMMSHEELKNTRHILKVENWSDEPNRYEINGEENFKEEDYIKLLHKKYPHTKKY